MSQRRHATTLPDGTILFALAGADGEDEEQDEPEDDEVDAGGDDGDGAGDGEDTESLEDLKAQLAEALTLKADFERRMRAADRTAHRYLTENDELKRTKTQAQANGEVSLEDQVKDLKAQLADRQSGDSRGKVLEAFTTSDKYDWQNRKVAFDLLDISDVGVDSRGRLDQQALEDAMDDLARNHPYLVKTAEKKEEPRPKPERPSGAQPGAHRRDRNKPDAAKLAQKYPQLAGRN